MDAKPSFHTVSFGVSERTLLVENFTSDGLNEEVSCSIKIGNGNADMMDVARRREMDIRHISSDRGKNKVSYVTKLVSKLL
jgi:hypothetical protein